MVSPNAGARLTEDVWAEGVRIIPREQGRY
jgi:hypothetical protein